MISTLCHYSLVNDAETLDAFAAAGAAAGAMATEVCTIYLHDHRTDRLQLRN